MCSETPKTAALYQDRKQHFSFSLFLVRLLDFDLYHDREFASLNVDVQETSGVFSVEDRAKRCKVLFCVLHEIVSYLHYSLLSVS